jgi:hypothetical protein
MQARAIFEAVVQVAKKGIKVIPEVMIPLIGNVKELENQKTIVAKVAGFLRIRRNAAYFSQYRALGGVWGGPPGSGGVAGIAPRHPPTPPDVRFSASGG